MSKLIVIRHAQVAVDFNLPASDWPITEHGIEATRQLALAEPWNEVARIYHSPELKAAVTASVISEISGVPTAVKDDLRELYVPMIQPHEAFVRRFGAYLDGYNDPEFENWDNATNRIVHCVKQLVHREEGKSFAVVSHGRIITVLFSYLFKRRLTVDDWQSIHFPDLSVVDLNTWTVERGFFANGAK